MVKHIFAVKDELVGFKAWIIVDESVDSAIRQFKASMRSLLTSDNFAPVQDMNLYELGTFNLRNGLIESHEPKPICFGFKIYDEFHEVKNNEI